MRPTVFRSFLLAAVFAAACALLSGCSLFQAVGDVFSPPSNPNPSSWVPSLPASAAMPVVSGNRPLRPDDKVEITIQPPSTAQTINWTDTVNAFGVVTLPHVGEVKIDRLTTTEAEKAIRDVYLERGIFSELNVRVNCPGMIHSQRIYVEGCVKKIGAIDFRDGMTLQEAVILAGGLNAYASGDVILARNGVLKTFDLNRIKKGKAEDPELVPGDRLEARESRF